MADAIMEQRVTQLEKLVAEVWNAFAETDQRIAELAKETQRMQRRMTESSAKVDRQIAETQRQMTETQRQMTESSAKVDRQIAETQRQMTETRRQMAESSARTDQRLDKLSDEVDKTIQELRKKWGELSNRLGTLAEDFVSPSVPRILRMVVDCPEDKVAMTALRVQRHHTANYGRSREFDVVAVCGDYVLINETKSTLNPEGVKRFVTLMTEARDFFPEYSEHYFIGAIAALQMDESVARYAEKQGLIVLGLSDGLMEVMNKPQFTPKLF